MASKRTYLDDSIICDGHKAHLNYLLNKCKRVKSGHNVKVRQRRRHTGQRWSSVTLLLTNDEQTSRGSSTEARSLQFQKEIHWCSCCSQLESKILAISKAHSSEIDAATELLLLQLPKEQNSSNMKLCWWGFIVFKIWWTCKNFWK